jgi:hypothetical protein
MQFSQRDPRWAADLLGSSDITLGRAGCLVTAAATMIADWGAATDPGRLNAWLRSHGGYLRGNLLIFSTLVGLGAQCVGYVDCKAVPAPVARMRDALSAGNVVLAAVDWSPGGTVQSHWVRILALDERDGQVMDPWQMPAKELVKLSKYLASDWDAARGIFEVAFYRKVGDTGGPSSTKEPEARSPAYQGQLYLRPHGYFQREP